MRFLKYLFVFLSILFSMEVSAKQDSNQENNGGLYLDFDLKNDLRASYDVFEKPIRYVQDSLTIRFELRLIGKNQPIGHFFNISTEKDKKDLLNIIVTKSGMPSVLTFNLNLTAYKTQLTLQSKEEEWINRWIPVEMRLNLKKKEASLSIDGQKASVPLSSFKDINEKVKYTFGIWQHYISLFPFAIKELKIQSDRNHYYFPMKETEGEFIHNVHGKKIGRAKNHKWYHEFQRNWELSVLLAENEIAGIYQDEETNSIILYTTEKIYHYNIGTNELLSENNNTGCSFQLDEAGSGNYLYLPERHQFFLYNKTTSQPELYAFYNNLPYDHYDHIAVYDHAQRKILKTGKSIIYNRYHHSNAFRNLKNDRIYEFGGYSNYRYHNSFHCLNTDTCLWEETQFTGDTISPRFYASVSQPTAGKDCVYLYGGYGNEDGSQDSGGLFYHDFYQIDLSHQEVKKITDFEGEQFDQVPCRDLIVKPEEKKFYTLCFPQYLKDSAIQLYEFSWDKNEIIPLGNQIPILCQQITTEVHLFENKKYECLLCVIQECEKLPESNTKTENHIKIYRINVPIADSPVVSMESDHSRLYNSILWILLILAIGTGMVAIIWRKKKVAETGNPSGALEREMVLYEDNLEEGKDNQAPVPEEIKRNSIYLLGDFTVFDKNGADITHLFSSKIRQLFLLILLHTYRSSSHGITSKEISLTIWPERELDDSKNIRCVTVNSLRNALGDLEGIKVVGKGGKWTIEIDPALCFCDLSVLLNQDFSAIRSYDEMKPYVHLLRRGNLLSTENFDWLDNFKSEYEEVILAKLSDKMTHAFEEKQYVIAYKLSQVLLNIDPLNEELIKIQINSLIYLGDPLKAKMKFRQFSVSYQEAYGENLNYEDFVL